MTAYPQFAGDIFRAGRALRLLEGVRWGLCLPVRRRKYLWNNWFASLAAPILLTLVLNSASAQIRSSTPAKRSSSGVSSAQAEPSKPATVTLKDGQLMIDASNSDLRQILEEISRKSGMVIHGEIKSTRVFGVYGPHKPEVVLTQLLEGLDYNFITRTSPQGGLRELDLTSRTASTSPPAAPPIQVPVPQEQEPVLGPGAVAHPPPAESDDFQLRRQRNLERLQQMHDAQEKQQDGHQ